MADNLPATTEANLPAKRDPMELLSMAVEQGADPDKLGQLMELQRQWQADRAAETFADRLAAFQAECPQIEKKRGADFKGQHAYNFASLDDIMRIVQPILAKHGLTVGFSAETNDAGTLVTVECRVRCGSHVEVTRSTFPLPDSMRVNKTQQMGAALSYAKRYALCAALNIIVTDEDRDAHGLAKTVTDEQAESLRTMAEALGENVERRCLAWLGVACWLDVPARRFNEVRENLRKKAAVLGNSDARIADNAKASASKTEPASDIPW